MATLANHEAARRSVLKRVFDRTACTLVPLARAAGPNGPLSPDTARTGFDFDATLDLEPQSAVIAGERGLDPSLPGSMSSIACDALLSAYVTGWPYLPKREDHVVANGVTYSIAMARKDGTDRRSWYLNEVAP